MPDSKPLAELVRAAAEALEAVAVEIEREPSGFTPLMDAGEAARLLNISRSLVTELAQAGNIPAIEIARGPNGRVTRRFSADALLAWAESRQMGGER